MFKYKEVIIILVVIFIAGCASTGGSSFFNRDKNSGFEEEIIFEGINGLELAFLEGAPPKEVYQNSPFDIVLEMHNDGALDIVKGTAKLGISLLFDVDDTTKSFQTIMGKENFQLGETAQIRWDGIDLKRTAIRKDSTENINVQVCYEGGTLAQPEVCVRPRPGKPGVLDGGCTVGEKSVSGGQGGPIAITKILDNDVREQGDSNVITFRIQVENVGGGDVINKGEVDDCKLSARDKQEARIDIQVGWLDGTEFECNRNTDGKLVMNNGKGLITCVSSAVPNDQHYSTPLNIKMNYGYVDSIKTSLTVKKDAFIS